MLRVTENAVSKTPAYTWLLIMIIIAFLNCYFSNIFENKVINTATYFKADFNVNDD